MKPIIILIMFFSVVFCACDREVNKETVIIFGIREKGGKVTFYKSNAIKVCETALQKKYEKH